MPKHWHIPVLFVLGILAFVLPNVYEWSAFQASWVDTGMVSKVLANFAAYGETDFWNIGNEGFFDVEHFAPTLLLFSPLSLWFGTLGYILVTSFACAITPVVFYRFLREFALQRTLCFVVSFAILLSPYTYAIALSKHWESLFLPAILGFGIAIKRSHFAASLLLAVAICGLKEDAWVYVILAAATMLSKDNWKIAASSAVVAAGYFVGILRTWHPWYYESDLLLKRYFQEAASGHSSIITKYVYSAERFWNAFQSRYAQEFIKSLLFVPYLALWRFIPTAIVLGVWTSYQGGPPRSTLSVYYSYAPLSIVMLCFPFAMRNLNAIGAYFENRFHLKARINSMMKRWEFNLPIPVVTHVTFMNFVIGVMLVHLCTQFFFDARRPLAIRELTRRWDVYAPIQRTEDVIARRFIETYINTNQESALAQWYSSAYISWREQVFLSYHDAHKVVSGEIQPHWVLLDVEARDPAISKDRLEKLERYLRTSPSYELVTSESSVHLFRLAER